MALLQQSSPPDRARSRGTTDARGRLAGRSLPRGLRIVSASLLALTLPLAGATAAQAAPTDGALAYGDSLFTGIGNGGYDVSHYDVAIDYVHQAVGTRPAGDVIATTTITATAPEALSSFSLDFEGMNVDSVTVNGAAATFTRPAINKPAESYKLVISPTAPVQGEFKTVVKYSGVPSKHIDNDGSTEGWVATANGVIALGQPVGTMAWLPSNNTPADKATFDIALTIPTVMNGAPAQAVSNGELASTTDNGNGSSTWRWTQLKQQATMSTMIGIGNYDLHQSTITLTDGRQIPEWSYIDASLTAAQKATTLGRLGRMQEIHQFLESKYGPYPGNSTGIIVHKSNVGYALETQDRSYFPSTPGFSTLIHEIAHQWFGAAVTPNDWNNIWMSEGQASYASQMFDEEIGLGAAPGKTTAQANFATWNSTAASSARWLIAPAAMTDQVELFNWQSYTRGGMTYEALRQVVGDDVFFDILTTWAQTNSGQSKSTADFIALAEEKSGKDLEAFFQDWLYDGDKPNWPSTWTLDLASTPASGEVARGSEISYTLTAANTGLVDLSGTATVDLSDVLDDATIDATTLDPTLSLTDNTLTWAVPVTTGTATSTVSFTVKVGDRAYGAALNASAAGTLGAFCGTCTVEFSTAAVPAVTEESLTEASRGTIQVPTEAAPGDTVTVQLGTHDYDGTEVGVLLFSSPTDLGVSTVTDGALTTTIPETAPVGAHRIAVVDDIGLLIGWDDIEIAKADAAVPPTPPTPPTGVPNGGSDSDGPGTDGPDTDGTDTSDPKTTDQTKTDKSVLASTGAEFGGLFAGGIALILGAAVVVLMGKRRRTGA